MAISQGETLHYVKLNGVNKCFSLHNLNDCMSQEITLLMKLPLN